MVESYGLPSPSFGELAGSSKSRSKGRLSSALSSRHSITVSSGDGERDTSEYLNVAERWWRAHQPWLERHGYLLRSRYRKDWIPSWERKGLFSKQHASEDMIELPVSFERSEDTADHISSSYDLGHLEKDGRHEDIGWDPRSPPSSVGNAIPGSHRRNAPPHLHEARW